ncbi:MAG: right-handed parallel beta-helix repeat-containing protein [Deltaproteobacteria bacterium]|nr:right-handed parallel beta-helix repeat-containing protein [Deltaproteobacteria bacterium]
MDYIITDFGATGDGITNDAAAIQSAIDACAKKGGGRVVIPGGNLYKTGSLILRSNIEFHIENDAILKASDNKSDYIGFKELENLNTNLLVPAHVNCEYKGRPKQFFIYACDSHNISITGKGVIDGSAEIHQGEVFKYYIEGDSYPRIPMIFFDNLRNLEIREINLTNSGFWTIHMAGCRDVLIDGIRIRNDLKMMNSDGIDPDHCKNVTIKNCDIECADDCIVFKTTAAFKKYGSCENISVSNCRLTSTSAAIKFGTESESDFRNIRVQNCAISRTNRGISIQLRDGANIENVSFSDITIETRRFSEHWWGEGEPIAITAVPRKKGVRTGKIRDISFNNIECVSENGIFIHGNPDAPVENISFENIKISLANMSGWAKANYDLRPCSGDGKVEARMSGAYLRYADNVRFKGFDLEADDYMKKHLAGVYDIKDCKGVEWAE